MPSRRALLPHHDDLQSSQLKLFEERSSSRGSGSFPQSFRVSALHYPISENQNQEVKMISECNNARPCEREKCGSRLADGAWKRNLRWHHVPEQSHSSSRKLYRGKQHCRGNGLRCCLKFFERGPARKHYCCIISYYRTVYDDAGVHSAHATVRLLSFLASCAKMLSAGTCSAAPKAQDCNLRHLYIYVCTMHTKKSAIIPDIRT